MLLRRKLAVALLILGGVLLWLAPQQSVGGYVLIGLGVVIEIVGALLERGVSS